MSAAEKLLDRPALVLNRHWAPIQVTSVREAIGLVAKGSAKIIDPETFETFDFMSWAGASKAKERFGDAMIRSVSLSIAPPEVVLLTTYDGLGERSVVFSRRNIFKRDRYTCQYCSCQYRGSTAMQDLTIDHVMPKSRGGKSSWENCVLACVICNAKKANRTPEEAKMHLRRAPKKPKWSALMQIAPNRRLISWNHFLSESYWNIELEP